MAKWAFNNQPRCKQCKRFISRDNVLHLCSKHANWHAVQAAEDIRCTSCQRPFDINDTGWRFNGETWEHKCPENHGHAGYFTAERIQP